MEPKHSDYFIADSVTPSGLDFLLESGWRHFSTLFFRYEQSQSGNQIYPVIPLRIRLDQFNPGKSHLRLLRKNNDLSISVEPTRLSEDLNHLFQQHSRRFVEDRPESLDELLSYQPATVPCRNEMITIRKDGRLIAASFLDRGEQAASSVYAVFDPDLKSRGLGILTMLVEIDRCLSDGLAFYYPGYGHAESSHYDYKKQFHGMEAFHWESGQWIAVPRFFTTDEWLRLTNRD